MTDPLMRYFEQELTFVRRALGQFGQQHTAHAERLNIHQGQIEDPSLARLLDGVALLNATVEKQLTEQLPEVVEGLLGVLYPSYIQTIPSVAYLQLEQEDAVAESVLVPKGSHFTSEAKGNLCQFTTVDDLESAPFSLTDTSASSAPFKFNRPLGTEQAAAVIQLSFSTGDPETYFSQLDHQNLDLFVQGFENNADSLVELLLGQTKAISISDSQCDKHVVLPAEKLKSRISDLNFLFLPQKGNQFSGFQLISEFFFFKEKRQFFRLKDFGKAIRQFACSDIKLNLFMNSIPTEFMRLFDNQVFKLNIVPAINLFEQTGEPTNYDQRCLTIPVNADAHSGSDIEVVEVKEVFEITPQGEKPLIPLFRDSYKSNVNSDYWQSARDINGQFKLAISLRPNHDLEFNKLYGTHLICTNGKEACGINGHMECLENIDLPGDFKAIYPPTAPIGREQNLNLHWQFVGLLNSNFSSLLHAENPTEKLKQMLQLCSREQISSEEIQAIHSVSIKSQVSAIRIMGKNVFSPGTEIELTLDTQGGFLVFSDVLNRFFQQFCSFDRYIQLSVRIYGRDGIAKRYPKVHGSQLAM
ncbi:type VI secretion system baseplate subunit TssF [Vibrio ostreicida]|uniref:Type VI secretion system baseplate subunit TssF n=1 Tax=Vibrio ostreicida TaxID=526588 RepID=A0ABT8BSJ9_9VIBR|nr:type VI secretion system baseplate subunit TssF [Vibrio ostreicida]MDN3610121.1 type VI secretion system baseplate subunit TssF [Vibrio ostreicida]NPD07854.1 type VI secretion system baseplate subunit TssF [Vibrio ostreicida]